MAVPMIVTLDAIAAWFLFGFFVGLGWALAAWLVGRFLR